MAKAAEAFRTISEVADDLGIHKHVLRFWEVKFAQIRPMKRGGGRRYYRPEDMELLRGIRQLLHRDGYTIKGVQKILREQGVEAVKASARSEEEAVPASVAPATAAGDAAPDVIPPWRERAAMGKGSRSRAADAERRAVLEGLIAELAGLRAMLKGEARPDRTASAEAATTPARGKAARGRKRA